MSEVSPFQVWRARTTFLAVGLGFVAWQVVPFDLSAGRLPWPDVFYCITMVYVIRCPEYAPVWAIFAVFFMRDVLTMAPLGLTTLLMVFGTEIVRANIQAFREYAFGLEWLWVAGIFAGIVLGGHIILGLTLSQAPRLLDQVWLILFTAAAYPVTVFSLKFGFGFERPQPGEFDAYGRRL
ncbi:MAG: hypothetical protein AAF631_03460 [Pseudomonadota bacterium]